MIRRKQLTWIRVAIVCNLSLLLVACSLTKRVYQVHYDNVHLSANGKPIATKLAPRQQRSIQGLTATLMTLGTNIDAAEAKEVAYDAVVYPMILANRWRLMSSPWYHNGLVNTGKRPRGLCYQWAEDMTTLMKKKNLRSFDLHRGVVFRHQKDEHNTMIISAKGASLKQGIILDPWRSSGVLFWSRVTEDKAHQAHPWRKFK